MGIGGAPEGVITAAALRCLGGEIQARFRWRSDEERARAERMGIDASEERVYTTTDLAPGESIVFSATGVTEGDLLNGVRFFGGGARTHSLVMGYQAKQVRFVDTVHMFDRDRRRASVCRSAPTSRNGQTGPGVIKRGKRRMKRGNPASPLRRLEHPARHGRVSCRRACLGRLRHVRFQPFTVRWRVAAAKRFESRAPTDAPSLALPASEPASSTRAATSPEPVSTATSAPTDTPETSPHETSGFVTPPPPSNDPGANGLVVRWTPAEADALSSAVRFSSIASRARSLVALGERDVDGPAIWTSPDETNWKVAYFGPDDGASVIQLAAVAAGSAGFIAVGSYDTVIAGTEDVFPRLAPSISQLTA